MTCEEKEPAVAGPCMANCASSGGRTENDLGPAVGALIEMLVRFRRLIGDVGAALVHVEVRAADIGDGEPNDGVGRLLDLGIGDAVDADCTRGRDRRELSFGILFLRDERELARARLRLVWDYPMPRSIGNVALFRPCERGGIASRYYKRGVVHAPLGLDARRDGRVTEGGRRVDPGMKIGAVRLKELPLLV